MVTVMREKKWLVRPPRPREQAAIASGLGVSSVTARILVNRNITNLQDGHRFLNNKIDHLYNPFLFSCMDKITSRIGKAIRAGKHITVYGDYDADGICGTALLVLVLKELGAHCDYYLPHREEEGYGLNQEAIRKCRKSGTDLLITTDCGTGSTVEVDYALSIGMEVIITDHHSPSGPIPQCTGVINPKLSDCPYPYKELAGVGVAYKLAQALSEKVKPIDVTKHLDLVAIGSIADIVPLTGENRILVHHGLQVLRDTSKIGLQALKLKSGVIGNVQTNHVAFRLAPRINAAGRMDSAESALKLLLTSDPATAKQLSNLLDTSNRERQKIERRVSKDALRELELKFNVNSDKVIVLENDNWPVGVIGIVASRIARQYNRPCIIINVTDKIGKGSGRSIRSFHLLDALKSCTDHLLRFGGHAFAAGLSIEEILIPSFRQKINQYANSVLTPDDLIPQIEIDAEASFLDLSFDFIEQLNILEPFGRGNPDPLLVSRGLQLYRDPIIVGKNHLKVWLKSGKRVFEAIGFGMGDYISLFNESNQVDLVFRPRTNTWNNKEIIQLHIVDMKVS